MICPCKDCPNRKITCHGTCEKYLNWQKEHDLENKIIREKTQLANWAITPKQRRNR